MRPSPEGQEGMDSFGSPFRSLECFQAFCAVHVIFRSFGASSFRAVSDVHVIPCREAAFPGFFSSVMSTQSGARDGRRWRVTVTAPHGPSALSGRLSCSCQSCLQSSRRWPHSRLGLWSESSLQRPPGHSGSTGAHWPADVERVSLLRGLCSQCGLRARRERPSPSRAVRHDGS